ncbi:MAG: ClpX C4-type zinc finger protein [Vicinamibacterales bacterium]
MADPDLLQNATTAGARLAEAERQALLCRAEYHTAIRRLHLAGASLREIAQALSLSHQRVQQIVAAAGGSWWRRVWRTRTLTRDAVCTWCDRPPSEVSRLIAGPNVYICDACVRLAEQTLAGRSESPETFKRARRGTARLCAFCYKRGTSKRALVRGPANVCSDCVRLCREILDGRAA